MDDRAAWTTEAVVADAALHGLPAPSDAFAERLAMLVRKAAALASELLRDFDREHQRAGRRA